MKGSAKEINDLKVAQNVFCIPCPNIQQYGCKNICNTRAVTSM